jgi:HEAT repeat protein
MSDSAPSIEGLIRDLDAPVRELAEAAQGKLAALGEPAVPLLLRALEHPRRGLRVGAALTLGRMREARATPKLIEIVEGDEDPSVRPLALRAISDIASSEATDELKIFLIRRLGDEDMFVRALACRGLGNIGDDTSRKALQLATDDKEKWVRDAAREALAQAALRASSSAHGAADEGTSGDDGAQATDGGAEPPQRALVTRDEAAPPPEVGQLRSLDPATQREAQHKLAARGADVVPHVARLLWVHEKSTRRAATELLGRIGTPLAVDQLTRLLENDELESGLRATTLYALGQAAARALRAETDAAPDFPREPDFPLALDFPLELVEAHLDDPDTYVRAAAVVSLLRAGGNARRLGAQALIDDEEEWVHDAGARALAELASGRDRVLRDTLVSGLVRITEPSAQAHLLVALNKIIDPPQEDDQMVVGPASFFLDSDEEAVRQAALLLVLAASRQLDGALLARIHELLDRDPDAEPLIAQTLRRIARPGDEAPVALLVQLTRSPDVATVEAACEALARVGSIAAVDGLIQLANSPRSASKLATEALDGIDPDAAVVATSDESGQWVRQLQPRCECGGSPTWVQAGEREELRCPDCDIEYVQAASGRLFRGDRTPFGSCLCCPRKQPLIRGGRGQTLVCPTTNEVHVRPHDAPRQILRLSALPLGACACCDEPQPLVPVAERVVCRRTRSEHVPGPNGYQLPNQGPAVAADIDAINAALLAGSLGIGQSGVPLAQRGDDEDES